MDVTALPGWDNPRSAPTVTPGSVHGPSAPARLLDGLGTFPCSLPLLSSLRLPLPVTALLSPRLSVSKQGSCLLLARALSQPRTVHAVAEGDQEKVFFPQTTSGAFSLPAPYLQVARASAKHRAQISYSRGSHHYRNLLPA